MELRSADLVYRSWSIKTIGDGLMHLCPLAYELAGNPYHPGWNQLLDVAEQAPSLAPLQTIIISFAADRLSTGCPLQNFLSSTAKEVPIESYFAASSVALNNKDSHPVGAFLLAYLSMMGWIYKLGVTSLYAAEDGLPNPGWGIIPFACADTLACESVGGYWTAKEVVNEARDLLSMTKATSVRPFGIDAAIAKYLELDKKIVNKLNHCISNLAEDIRESCGAGESHWRPEIGAMLWTLGQVPESTLFRKSTGRSHIPSLHFFRRLVSRSLSAIPADPLVQYIWLQLKDRLPVNLRGHRVLFAVINARYNHPYLESGFPVSIAEAYAKAIIALFRGTLDDYTIQVFCDNFSPFSQVGDIVDVSADLRIAALGIELSRSECEAGRKLRSVFAENMDELMTVSLESACNVIEESVIHPEWPNCSDVGNAILHELIEIKLAAVDSSFDPTLLMECVTAVEQLRASAISYWLMITPPLLQDYPEDMEYLLREDAHLRRMLRSAYFMANWGRFPEHYRLFSVSVHGASSPFVAAQEQLKVPTDCGTGRERYRKARRDLADLTKRMETIAPGYASRRGNPIPSSQRIFELLNSHK